MVRRRIASEKRDGHVVCANVFGLFLESVTPDHDGIRPLSSYVADTVCNDHFRYQV